MESENFEMISEDSLDWNQFEKQYNKYMEEIKSEGPFLLCSHYIIEGSPFELQCGMSFARNFEPAVRLVNNQNKAKISFNRFEWKELVQIFIHSLSTFFKWQKEEDSKEIIIDCEEDVKILKTKYMGGKILKMSNAAGVFHLNEEIINRILKFNNTLICSKISTLENLNFLKLYAGLTGILKTFSKQLEGKSDRPTILSAFCNSLGENFESYCVKECVIYYYNKVLNDIS